MLLVNLLMGLGLGDRTHLWYVAFVTASAVYFAIDTGSVNRFLAPTVAAQDLFRPALTFLVLMVVTGVQFSRRFLDTAQRAPRLDRVMRIFLALAALVIPLAWLGPPPVALTAMGRLRERIGPAPVLVHVPPPAPTQVQPKEMQAAGGVSSTVEPGALLGPPLVAVIV